MSTNVMIEFESFDLDISPEINNTPQMKTFVRVRCMDCDLSHYGTYPSTVETLAKHLAHVHMQGETATEYIKKHPNMWTKE